MNKITAEESVLEREINQHINFSDYYYNMERDTIESAAHNYYVNESLWHLKVAAELNEKLRKLRIKNNAISEVQLQNFLK